MKRGRSTGKPTKDEGFVPVPGIPHAYITENGDVASDHPGNSGRWGEFRRITQHDNGRGYLRASIAGVAYLVHRMVAAAFIGPSEGKEVNHKDGDKRNNHYSNLEYVSRSENMRHANRMGLAPKPRGEDHPLVKLTDAQVGSLIEEFQALLINGRVKWGEGARLARKYGVSDDYPRALYMGRATRTRE
jgi:hypothetical protein